MYVNTTFQRAFDMLCDLRWEDKVCRAMEMRKVFLKFQPWNEKYVKNNIKKNNSLINNSQYSNHFLNTILKVFIFCF